MAYGYEMRKKNRIGWTGVKNKREINSWDQ
jgi:hypothetical protein